MTALVLALAAGAAVGLALGALGGGGGMIAVPALVYLLGFAPVEAATASLVVVAVTAAAALYGHARDGRVRWATGLLFAAAGAGPAVLAARLASGVPPARADGRVRRGRRPGSPSHAPPAGRGPGRGRG
ncbi:TSUP family transporter [Streptomyces fradiae]|uniref:TSUP family transporter n=1 Tax=Streptomyces fradiae TaxID=1906 RepID=UPI0035BE66B1